MLAAGIVSRVDSSGFITPPPGLVPPRHDTDTRTERISGARIFMAQEIRRGDEALIAAKVEAAIIGENGRPKRFPAEWIAAFMPGGA